MPFGLDKSTLDKINSVFCNYIDIEKVILYGSRAKGNYKNGSDIDLTLFGKKLNLSTLSKIDNEIDDLLLPYTFDLSLFHNIDNSDLIDHIHRVGQVFYLK